MGSNPTGSFERHFREVIILRKSYVQIGSENLDLIISLIQQGKSKTFIAKTIFCERRTLVKILKHYDLDSDCRGTKKADSVDVDGETIRQCKLCLLKLSLENYYVVNKRLSRVCKECYKRKSKSNYDKKISAVAEYKSNCGCAKCGDKRSYILEFHHIDPSKKDYTIANRARASLESIMSEIKKCVVLCSNCHQEFHHLERKERLTIQKFLNAEVVYLMK